MSKNRGALLLGLLSARLLVAPLESAPADDSASLRLSGTVPACANIAVANPPNALTLRVGSRQPAAISVTAESSVRGSLVFRPSQSAPPSDTPSPTSRITAPVIGHVVHYTVTPRGKTGYGDMEPQGTAPSHESIRIVVQAN